MPTTARTTACHPTAEPSAPLGRAKLVLAVLLTLWVTAPYFLLQRCVFLPVRLLGPGPVDDAVPFQEWLAWLYLSLYLLLPLAPLGLSTREQVRRFAGGIAVIALVSHLAFALWPTRVARPDGPPSDLAYRLVVGADNGLNACPSLHASLAVFSALWCHRLLGRRRGAAWVRLGLWAWTLAILYATLAVRQHVLTDLLAGAALASLVFAAAELSAAPRADEGRHAEAATPAWVRARALVLEGLGEHIAPLRTFDARKRVAELALFVALWAAGASLTIFCHRNLPEGWRRLLPCGAGVLLSAVALNAFVLLLHEGMHGTLFGRSGPDRWVSFLLGVPLLMSFSAYQVMHLRHHTYLGDPRDPDDYANYTSRPRLLWLMHFLRLLFGSFLYLLLIPLLSLRHGTPAQRRRVVVEYVLLGLLAAAAARAVPGDVLLLGWFLPVVLVGYFTNLRGFTQHGITEAADPFLASRTMKPHALVAFCLLNENYHLEHHLFPEVPSYHLPRLHELIWPRLPRAVVGRSYTAFLARFLRATLTLDQTPIGLVRPRSQQGSSQHEETAA